MQEQSKNIWVKKNYITALLFLIVCSFSLLFINLGYRSLWGSEGRWAEVVRQMFLTGDFFHPQINGEPYFDKPLFTYWAIAVFVPIFGKLNEFVIRLPSALSGLCAIFCTYFLGTRLFSKKVALLASSLLLLSWGFVFWARTAAADMENLAFILLAVSWYFLKKNEKSFFSYFVFYAICAIGAQFKGLTAIAVPVLVVFIDIILEKRLTAHITFSHLLAIIISVIIYLAPFIYAQLTNANYSEQGLYLVFRENLLRFFNAFDHKEPFYVYIFYVPILILPWIFFLLGFLFSLIKDKKEAVTEEKWLYFSTLAIFLLFTASSSRRSYYILPILPFLTLCIATYLLSYISSKKQNPFIELQAVLVFILGFIQALSPLLWPMLSKIIQFSAPFSLKLTTFAIGILSLLPFFIYNYFPFKTSVSNTNKIITVIASAFILFIGFFVFQQNELEVFRTQKRTLMEVKDLTQKLAPSQIAISKNMASVSFYLNKKGPVINLEKAKNVANFFLKDGKKLLIARKKDLKKFQNFLQNCKKQTIISSEEFPWSKRNNKGLIVIQIFGKCQ